MKLPDKSRALTNFEMQEAKKVFQETIPWNLVRITDSLGIGNREFTVKVPLRNEPMSSQIAQMLVGEIIKFSPTDFCICLNLGPAGYANALGVRAHIFIHEMTHAWQYTHGNHVIADSMFYQAVCSDAYAYTPGKPWDSYNVEQQAHIVEDWYQKGKMSEKSPLFHYVRDYIRKGVIR